MSGSLRIVKVGGSLYDLPDLGARLGAWLGNVRTLLIPGGGPIVDAIRALDQVHELGDEAAHWLALRALSVNAAFLGRLLPGAQVVGCLPQPGDDGDWFILDPLPFFQEDERRPGSLPHTWQVTSDSLAVRVAVRARARELMLLKSLSRRAADGWDGVVDGYFTEALQQAPNLQVRVVNLRAPDYERA
jgi:5-(aminomethyl)-3-furanmethanol phosphate kinase